MPNVFVADMTGNKAYLTKGICHVPKGIYKLSTSQVRFCQRTSFLNNRLDILPWTSFLSDSYTKPMIDSGVTVLAAAGSPFGVWMNHLYGGPLLGFCF